ncbi:MAG: hypothetical protein ACRDS0_28360 [Pseudonocardiaceae bacterium]
MTRYRRPPGESCPGYGHLEGVELTSATARVIAWTCTRCRMDWAISPVNPGALRPPGAYGYPPRSAPPGMPCEPCRQIFLADFTTT